MGLAQFRGTMESIFSGLRINSKSALGADVDSVFFNTIRGETGASKAVPGIPRSILIPS